MTWDAVVVVLAAVGAGVWWLFSWSRRYVTCRSCRDDFALWERQVAGRDVEVAGDE